MDDITRLKQQAAYQAASLVQSGMVVGLGHGSTAIWAVRRIAERLQQGDLKDIFGIPVSKHIEQEAHQVGIPLSDFERHTAVDMTIDGADEVDPQMNLIKGGGGALLREKIVAQASWRNVIVVDETKLSPTLGTRFALPVEVVPFGWRSQQAKLSSLGAIWILRRQANGTPFVTDQGNHILDGTFSTPPDDIYAIARTLEGLATVVGHGLFLDLATDLIVASSNGIEHRQRPR